MPGSDASDRLRRVGAKESGGLAGLERVNRCVFRRPLRNDERPGTTLDIDAAQIAAENVRLVTSIRARRVTCRWSGI
jgi:hypothetical protein